MTDIDLSVPRVPISQIRTNPAALREVDKESEKYLRLVDSVRARGVLNPVVVRKLVDPETNSILYGLVDGLHRYSAAQDAGFDAIPANIVSASDLEATELQIITNLHRVETKAVEWTKALQAYMCSNPLMTVLDFAKKFNCSVAWINDRLGLLRLAEPIQKLVDEGKITLTNAYTLSKLKDHKEQGDFLERAQTMSPGEFTPTVTARVKEINDARRQGRAAQPETFKPQPFPQKVGDVRAEFDHPAVVNVLHKNCDQDTKLADYKRGFAAAVAWFLHMDPLSQQQQVVDNDTREAKKKADKAGREQESKQKRLEKAQAEAAKIQAELASVQS